MSFMSAGPLPLWHLGPAEALSNPLPSAVKLTQLPHCPPRELFRSFHAPFKQFHWTKAHDLSIIARCPSASAVLSVQPCTSPSNVLPPNIRKVETVQLRFPNFGGSDQLS
ncbi:MAG: hypothetical protein ACTS42_02115 [Candidatus Hodgkinia cicadicola]